MGRGTRPEAMTLDAALRHISPQRVLQTCASLVKIPSPTGDERPLAEYIVGLLQLAGIDGRLMPIDVRMANAWARLPARSSNAGRGPTVMLYSPIDTVTSGDEDDVPWVADRIDGHLRANAVVDGERVVGLGAQNPKGHAAAVIEAAMALSETELAGDVIVAFGAGGMPTNARQDDPLHRRHTGQGVGASFLLEQGVWADAAIISKSGWFVQHEEVGIAWSDITVRGTHTYVGAKHRIPYRNPIADAARVVLHLEEWFAKRTDQTGSLEPQAMVASLHSGWARTAAFLPAVASLRVDQRLLPDTSPLDAHRVLLAELRTLVDVDLSAELVLAIPGSRTPIDHWICTAGRRAWEAIEQRSHVEPTGQSGATDANILRNRGIPTMRIGLPKVLVDGHELGFAEGMNTVDATSMTTLAELLVRTVVDVCNRDRGDL
jgi:acetylornithine deacetylase/succinyl-diaminopimelate desuccinylase-like protein